jgi:hypothetical protein
MGETGADFVKEAGLGREHISTPEDQVAGIFRLAVACAASIPLASVRRLAVNDKLRSRWLSRAWAVSAASITGACRGPALDKG